MEFFVGLALVFSGLIFGYWLWYSDRSQDEQRLHKLRRENDDLRTSLKLAHNSHSKLDERYNRQQGQLHVLQQLCDDWSQNREQHERERAELETLAVEQGKRADELREQLDTEKQRRLELEDQQHRLTQSNLEKIATIESGFRKQFQSMESSLCDRTTKVETLIADNESLKHRLKESEVAHEKVKSELANQKQLLHTAINNSEGLQQEYVSLESALSAKADEVSQLASEKREAESIRQSVEESMANLAVENQSLVAERSSLLEQVSQMDELVAQMTTLQATSENTAEQLALVESQRDSALESEASQQTVIDGLKKRLDNQEATIHRLRGKLDDALTKHKTTLDRQMELELTIEGLESNLEDFECHQTELAESHTLVVAQLTGQRDSFATQLEELQNEVALQLEQQSGAVKQLTAQRDQFSDQLRKSEEEIAVLTSSQQLRIDELVTECQQKTEQRDDARQQGQVLTERCEELTNLCAELEQQLDQAKVQSQSVSEERDGLRDQIGDLVCRIQELEQRQQEVNNERILDLQQHKLGHSNLTDQIETLRDQRDALLNELAQTRENHADATAELRGATSRIGTLTSRIEELDTRCQRITELEQLLQARQQSDLQTIDELQTLREQYAQTCSEKESLEKLAESLSKEQDTWRQAQDESAVQLQGLQTRLKASEDTIRNLRKERAAVLSRHANRRSMVEPESNVISFTEAMAIRAKKELDYDAEYGGPVRNHATRGVIYTEPPKEFDDLKRISGIAEVLEARLNDYGVYTFKQIMEWTSEAVEEFSHLLSFRDRISRDDWIGQATAFYREKQNTPKTFAA